jgi:hypothetical protein
MGCIRDVKRDIFLIITVLMLIFAIITPSITMAADDTIHVTFDPSGSVTLDVSPQELNFSTVNANSNEESSTTFTIWNNGTISMKTECETNTTTDEGNLSCDGDGTPGYDNFSLRFTSTTMDGNNEYISNSSASKTTLDNSLAAAGSDTFKITIYLGYLNDDFGWQTTTVNFTGSAAG